MYCKFCLFSKVVIESYFLKCILLINFLNARFNFKIRKSKLSIKWTRFISDSMDLSLLLCGTTSIFLALTSQESSWYVGIGVHFFW